jgi:hypothetical protein
MHLTDSNKPLVSVKGMRFLDYLGTISFPRTSVLYGVIYTTYTPQAQHGPT